MLLTVKSCCGEKEEAGTKGESLQGKEMVSKVPSEESSCYRLKPVVCNLFFLTYAHSSVRLTQAPLHRHQLSCAKCVPMN